MQQKINWMRFLIFGISLLFLFSCKRTKDYSTKNKWIFVNETNRFITYSNGPWGNNCNLKPNDSVIIEYSFLSEKNSKPVNSGSYLMPQIIYYDSILCDTQELNIGPGYIQNYQIKTIKNNDFEYRFVFTKAIALRADTCR